MYYVYRLIDPRTSKTFYVGKGTGERAYVHQSFRDSNKNRYKDNVIKQIHNEGLEVIVEFEHDNIIDEDHAYYLEECLIMSIGIENLTNLCLGSKPPSRKGKTYTMTEAHKANLSKALKGKKHDWSWNKGKTKDTDPRIAEAAKKRAATGNEHLRGKKLSQETVQKIKDALTGRKMTAEQVKKMKKAKKGRSWEEIYGVEGARKRREAIKRRKQKTAGMEDVVIE